MRFTSDSTGITYSKVKNMWIDCSHDTRPFPKLVNMVRSDIDSINGIKLVILLNVFIS